MQGEKLFDSKISLKFCKIFLTTNNFTLFTSSGRKVAISHLSIYNKNLISVLPEQEF
jgi:hypothetical protein